MMTPSGAHRQPDARIPVFVVTGFLGAGKTTLLRRLIESRSGLRFAVVVNEFGDMGFDGELIQSCCQDVVELKNGCICCRIGDDLVPTLETLIERDVAPDAILIESSGLALPQPVVDAFHFPTLARRSRVAGVVVAVDGPLVASGLFDKVLARLRSPPSLTPTRFSALHGTGDDPISEVLEDQLRAADLVIVTKVDQLEHSRGARLHKVLAERLPNDVALSNARHGVTDAEMFLSLAARAGETSGTKPSRHALEPPEHDHDDFEGLVIDLGVVADRFGLQDRITKAIRNFALLRVKGFVAVSGRDERFILQGTPSSTVVTADRPWQPSEIRTTRLVVIALKGLPGEAIRRALQEICS